MVDDELASRLVKMVRFRNLLVHRYWAVDPVRVLSYHLCQLKGGVKVSPRY